jgi:hypothetical protein
MQDEPMNLSDKLLWLLPEEQISIKTFYFAGTASSGAMLYSFKQLSNG